MINFKKLRNITNIKDFSLIVIPDIHGIHTKSFQLNLFSIGLYLGAFSLFVGVIVALIFILTPAKYVLINNDKNIYQQNTKIIELNKRVVMLSREVESISSLNKKLRRAIGLADPEMVRSLDSQQQQQPDEKKKLNPGGGNLMAAIVELFFQDNNPQKHSIHLIKPIGNDFISRDFNASRGHMGIDYPVKTGTPVTAAASGYVAFADYTAGDGYMIILIHDENYSTIYKHCSVLTKKVRDKVLMGEVIALSGNTGLNTTGPHLHFEVWRAGQAIDPKTVLIN